MIFHACYVLACAEVKVLTPEITRDSIKDNVRLLTVAGNHLGLRVGVRTCQVHVAALYDLMKINCPGQVLERIWVVVVLPVYARLYARFC